MTNRELKLLVELHKEGERQGPGSEYTTKLALALTGMQSYENLKVADIGCGTGAQTLTLAKNLNANIIAIDIFPELLESLEERAKQNNIQNKITTRNASMEELPFKEEEFDMIWSEGAIYLMGFEKGVKDWRRYLKPGGILAVSEISWIAENRPKTIQDFWDEAYPEMDTISNKIKVLEQNGFSPVAHFVLPEYCWVDNYYTPLEKRIPEFKEKYKNDKEVEAFIQGEFDEINLYKTYKDYFSYGFYIAKRMDKK